MNGKEIFLGLRYVDEDIIEEAEFGRFSSKEEKKPKLRRLSRPVLIAAIIAGLLLLAGCGTVVYSLTIAESPLIHLPLLGGRDIAYEDIQLTADHVTPSGMSISCKIDNDAFPEKRFSPDAENAIFILSGAPYCLERKTDTGWEALPKRIEDATWMADRVLTDGNYGWSISWSGVYGILAPGTYRLTTTVIEDLPEVSVEFTIVESPDLTTAQALEKCNGALQALMDRGSYHVRTHFTSRYGDMSGLPEGTFLGEELDELTELYKFEDDYLELSTHIANGAVDGMMKKDGVKYRLDHEEEGNSLTPVAGWSVWPDLDDERLAGWHAYSADQVAFPENVAVISDSQITFQVEPQNLMTASEDPPTIVTFFFHPDGTLAGIQSVTVQPKANGFNVDMTCSSRMDVLDTAPEAICGKIAEQDVNFYRPFSWKEDQKEMPDLDVTFQNTGVSPVTNAPEAIERALNECTVEYTKIVVYRDEKAGMWKVEFQILYGYQGYQYVYLNDDGITQMISGLGSKVEQWKGSYPDPE